MDTQLLTLSKIFTERLFRIPDYQRGYAWTEKQLKDFWTDIEQLEPGRNHYTGVLTLENVPESTYRLWDDDFWIVKAKSFQPFFVVDGQQRLTTAIVLIQVILENLPEGEKLNYTERIDIQRKFIFDSKDNGISRSYVFGYEKDNPSYEFLKTKVFLERSSTATSQETVYTHNLSQAKQFFSGLVTTLSREQLEALYHKVTQCLLFNIFTITEDVDVCVAFETMNNRGKALSYLELLKNRLIYLSLKFDAPNYERDKLRRAINDCWKAIYHNLGRNKDHPLDDDRFLLTHYVLYFENKTMDDFTRDELMRYRRVPRSDYARNLLEERFIPKNVFADADPQVRISLQDIYNYVSSLQEAVETWYKIYNPFMSDLSSDTQIWLDKLNRIGMEPFQHLILVYLQRVRVESKLIAFLKAIERYQFLISLVGSGAYRRLSSPIALEFIGVNAIQLATDLYNNKIVAEKVMHSLSEATTDILQQEDFVKMIQAYFSEEGFYEWRGIRYFLFEYDLELQGRSKTERAKILWPEFTERRTDFVSVEHIYPQNARHPYWTSRFNGLSSKQKKVLRNSLGNLLPLSKPKNSSLSNKPFQEKVDGKTESVIGYRYGCYAENEITKIGDWTPEQILERGLKMLKFMEKRWGLHLGDDQQKKSILGLDFIL